VLVTLFTANYHDARLQKTDGCDVFSLFIRLSPGNINEFLSKKNSTQPNQTQTPTDRLRVSDCDDYVPVRLRYIVLPVLCFFNYRHIFTSCWFTYLYLSSEMHNYFMKYLYKMQTCKSFALHDAHGYKIEVLVLRKCYGRKRVLYISNTIRFNIVEKRWLSMVKVRGREGKGGSPSCFYFTPPLLESEPSLPICPMLTRIFFFFGGGGYTGKVFGRYKTLILVFNYRFGVIFTP